MLWLEQVEIDFNGAQPRSAHETRRTPVKEFAATARALPGYDCIIGGKGIGFLHAALFPCTTGTIGRVAGKAVIATDRKFLSGNPHALQFRRAFEDHAKFRKKSTCNPSGEIFRHRREAQSSILVCHTTLPPNPAHSMHHASG